jgi:adhesin transport system outer membrane protein
MNLKLCPLFLVVSFLTSTAFATDSNHGVYLPSLYGGQVDEHAGIQLGALSGELGKSAPLVFEGAGKTSLHELDLRQAITRAVNWQPSIQTAIQVIAQQQGQIDYARAGYRPQISAGISSGKQNSYGNGQVATLSASQMLYDFGKVSGSVNQATGLYRREQANLLAKIDEVSRQTAEAVISVHRYQELVSAARVQLKATEDILKIAKLRADSGVTTQSDPVQAQSRVEGAQANLLQLQSLLEQWRDRLRTLIGVMPPEQMPGIPDLGEFARMDGRLNYQLLPAVLVAEGERNAALGALESSKAQRYPTISLEASTNKALSGVNPNNGEERGSFNTLTLNASAKLYEGGAISAQIRAARAAVDAADATIRQARVDAESKMLTASQQIRGSQSRLGVLSQRTRTMEKTQELYHKQYTLGSRSILDLLNAEQEMYLAQADEIGAHHDLWMGQVAYIEANGTSREAYRLNNTSIQGLELLP